MLVGNRKQLQMMPERCPRCGRGAVRESYLPKFEFDEHDSLIIRGVEATYRCLSSHCACVFSQHGKVFADLVPANTAHYLD